MNWKLALLLSLLAFPGSITVAWLAVPVLIETKGLAVEIETLQIITVVQSILLILLASVTGSFLGAKLGLRAPVMQAILTHGDVSAALRPQLLPGLFGGLVGAVLIVGFYYFAPAELAATQHQISIPLVVRVLYGGITEEILIRWGLMTFFVWGGWRVIQCGKGKPSAMVVWSAIGLSAFIFGLSHVPSVAAAIVPLPSSVIVYITVGNAIFGLVAGYLFWCYGLEAAMIAHILAHIIAYALHG